MARRIALVVNYALALLSLLLLGGRIFGFPKPSVGMMTVEIALPWMAVAAVVLFPQRFQIFPSTDERRIPLFGLLFYAAFAPIANYYYAPPVSRLPALELGCLEGAMLLAGIAMAERRANALPRAWMMAIVPCAAWGFATVEQVNCLLDRSPAVVYRAAVSSKFIRRNSYQLYLKPWGPHPAPRTLLTSYSLPVPRELFEAIDPNGEVCVVQRAGALGLAWYTVHTCPWNGGTVVLGYGGPR